jgi:hypothetical protein
MLVGGMMWWGYMLVLPIPATAWALAYHARDEAATVRATVRVTTGGPLGPVTGDGERPPRSRRAR